MNTYIKYEQMKRGHYSYYLQPSQLISLRQLGSTSQLGRHIVIKRGRFSRNIVIEI